jgi:hypothetical protein
VSNPLNPWEENTLQPNYQFQASDAGDWVNRPLPGAGQPMDERYQMMLDNYNSQMRQRPQTQDEIGNAWAEAGAQQSKQLPWQQMGQGAAWVLERPQQALFGAAKGGANAMEQGNSYLGGFGQGAWQGLTGQRHTTTADLAEGMDQANPWKGFTEAAMSMGDPTQLIPMAKLGALAAGAVKLKGKLYPEEYLARQMSWESLQNLMKHRAAGVPYEASGTFIGPKQAGLFGTHPGLVFDVADDAAIKGVAAGDAMTEFSRGLPGEQGLSPKTLTGVQYPERFAAGAPSSLENLYREQGLQRNNYNEAVADFGNAKATPMKGVLMPQDAPTTPDWRDEWKNFLGFAKEQKLPLFVQKDRKQGRAFWETLLDEETGGTGGTWKTGKIKGHNLPAYYWD